MRCVFDLHTINTPWKQADGVDIPSLTERVGVNYESAVCVDKLGILGQCDIFKLGVVKKKLLVYSVGQKLGGVPAEFEPEKYLEADFIAAPFSILISLAEKMYFYIPWQSSVNCGVAAEEMVGDKAAVVAAGFKAVHLLRARAR